MNQTLDLFRLATEVDEEDVMFGAGEEDVDRGATLRGVSS